jgi:MFS family permease
VGRAAVRAVVARLRVSRSIGQLLFWRTMQGFCTGAGLIVGRAIVRDLFEGPHAQKVMSLITLFFGVAPALAPVIGGFVYAAFGWPAVFGFLALYGFALWLLCLKALPETHPVALRHALRAAAAVSAPTSASRATAASCCSRSPRASTSARSSSTSARRHASSSTCSGSARSPIPGSSCRASRA